MIICHRSFIIPPLHWKRGGFVLIIEPCMIICHRSFIIPPLHWKRGGILFYLCPSVRPKMFITFFSVIIYGSNLIFDHRLQKGQSKVANPLHCPWSSQQMKISSDLGNRHPVTIVQLVMPAVELLEGWPQPKICLQILHKVDLNDMFSCSFTIHSRYSSWIES